MFNGSSGKKLLKLERCKERVISNIILFGMSHELKIVLE